MSNTKVEHVWSIITPVDGKPRPWKNILIERKTSSFVYLFLEMLETKSILRKQLKSAIRSHDMTYRKVFW